MLYWMDTWGLRSLGELALGLGDRSAATNIRNSHGIEAGGGVGVAGSASESVEKGGPWVGVVTKDA